jgi:hypothetical protein
MLDIVDINRRVRSWLDLILIVSPSSFDRITKDRRRSIVSSSSHHHSTIIDRTIIDRIVSSIAPSSTAPSSFDRIVVIAPSIICIAPSSYRHHRSHSNIIDRIAPSLIVLLSSIP